MAMHRGMVMHRYIVLLHRYMVKAGDILEYARRNGGVTFQQSAPTALTRRYHCATA